MADLTDDRLAQIIADRKECTAGEGRRMAIELMHRRAADLSEQDKAALRRLRQIADDSLLGARRTVEDSGLHDNYRDASRARDQIAKVAEDIAVLDRLLDGAEERIARMRVKEGA